MSVQPIDLTGGKSIYCLNEQQLERAMRQFQEDSPAGDRIRAAVTRLEAECSRNEQAAIAFLLIQHLHATE